MQYSIAFCSRPEIAYGVLSGVTVEEVDLDGCPDKSFVISVILSLSYACDLRVLCDGQLRISEKGIHGNSESGVSFWRAFRFRRSVCEDELKKRQPDDAEFGRICWTITMIRLCSDFDLEYDLAP